MVIWTENKLRNLWEFCQKLLFEMVHERADGKINSSACYNVVQD